MKSKKLRDFLCVFHVILCAMVFNQQSFAGTWADAFEDDNTQEWEIFNAIDDEKKWWIDDGEAVGETFEPHQDYPTIWATGELDWRAYSLSCKAKLVKVKDEPATLGLILHQRWEEPALYVFQILYPWKIVHITKQDKNGATTLGEFDFAAKLNRWYALIASIDNRGKLEFHIGKEVFSTVDPNPIKSGKPGLKVSGAQARFDDVEITGGNVPNGGPGTLSVEPSGKLTITWGELKDP